MVPQALRVAGGFGELGGQRREAGAHDDREEGYVALPEFVDAGIERGLAERLEQGEEVLAEAAGAGGPARRLDVDAHRDAPVRVDGEAERGEHRQQAAQPGLGMATGGRPHGPEQRRAERDGQRGSRTGLDLGGDPATLADLAEQLAQQHGPADPAQTAQDPAAVALAVLLGAGDDHVERFEQDPVPGEHRWSPAGTATDPGWHDRRVDEPAGADAEVVALFGLGVRFISRSEAKRVMRGLERFRRVELDFAGVEEVGQGFVDEALRVWPSQHPGTVVTPARMVGPVDFMVRRGLPSTNP